jgi:hypothetical protein
VTVTGPGSITGSDVAIDTGKLYGGGFTLLGNRVGLNASSTTKISDVTVTGGDYAVFSGRGGKATNLTVSGATYGVYMMRNLKLIDSTITGNAVDVLAVRTPRLVRSTCDKSARLVQNQIQPWNYDVDGPWGVCAND